MDAKAAKDSHERPKLEEYYHEATPEEGYEILDEQARRYLNMSGEEFLEKWDSGYFADKQDEPGVMHVAFLIPFGRPYLDRS